MTRSTFERMCFGDVSWSGNGESFMDSLRRGAALAKHQAAQPLEASVVSQGFAEAVQRALARPDTYTLHMHPKSMYVGGMTHDDFYLMYQPGMKLVSTDSAGKSRTGTVLRVDTELGQIELREQSLNTPLRK